MDAVVGEGELDGARYGAVLRPRGLVGLRGAGWSHDGLWYVRRRRPRHGAGLYRQKFTLAREGYGSTCRRWSCDDLLRQVPRRRW